MNLMQNLKSRRRDFLRAIQLYYAAFATWIPEIYPDFMCIGAPRAATTWLYQKLRDHPQIFLPKAKELHFFDEEPDTDQNDRSGLRWHRAFYFDMSKPAHFRWYAMQFRKARNRTKGDITPVYSMLSRQRVRLIAEKAPDVKIIYIIRNPIERAWSGLRKTIWYQKGANHKVKDRAWLLAAIMHPAVLERGNYRRAIETWGEVIPDGNMLYLFYDDIVEDPQSELARVCAFLGANRPSGPPASTEDKPVNAAPALRMPDEVRSRLSQHYKEQIQYLEARFDRDLSHWTHRAG